MISAQVVDSTSTRPSCIILKLLNNFDTLVTNLKSSCFSDHFSNCLSNSLKKSLKKKYKFEYELSLSQKMKNDGNVMVFFDKGRIALYQFSFENSNGQLSQNTYIKYTKDPMNDYKRFKPNKVKKIESSEL